MKQHKWLGICNLILVLVWLIHSGIQYTYDADNWPFYAVAFFNGLYYIAPFALLNLGYGLHRLVKRWSDR